MRSLHLSTVKAFSKPVIFGVLAILALVFVLLGIRSDSQFFRDLWQQLFWLTVGIIATTFILETIIEEGQTARRRNEDGFAFRSFSANLLHLLMRIKNLDPGIDDLFVSAIASKKQFAETVAKKVQSIPRNETLINIEEYNNSYLEIGSGLKDFSRGYIRLFCSSKNEMVKTFHELTNLSNHWKYKDELSKGYQEYTESMSDHHDAERRSKRQKAISQKMEEVNEILLATADYLADIAQKAALYKGMPSVK